MWIVGEYAAPSLNPKCTTDIMVQYHEALEVFAYEVNMLLRNAEAAQENPAYEVRGREGEGGFDAELTKSR